MLLCIPPSDAPSQRKSWVPSARTIRFFGFVAHPVFLVLASALSILLWMPFGVGYYGWPWKDSAARWLLEVFVLTFPISAVIAFVMSIVPQFSAGRFVMALLSLIVAMHGVLAMYHWINVYVGPMLEQGQRL